MNPSGRSVRAGGAQRGAACALAALLLACQGVRAQEPVALLGATLVDPSRPEPLAEARIIVADGRFACVSGPEGCPLPRGVEVRDVAGAWITPGLIDTHVHVDVGRAPEVAARQQALRFALGITTVRDGGGLQLDALLGERERARDGAYAAPRVVIAARPARSYAEEYGVGMGRPLVEHLVAMGVDAIKIKDHVGDDTLWPEEVRAAAALGVPSFGHTWRGPPPRSLVREAVAAGISGVSHLFAIAPAAQSDDGALLSGPPEDDPGFWAWRKALWLTTDPVELERLARQMIEAGVWLEPMLTSEYYWSRRLEPPPEHHYLRSRLPRLRHMLIGRDLLREEPGPTFPDPYREMASFVNAFRELGGTLLAGSDNVRPGLDLHEEIALLREAGLTPMESLDAATGAAAAALRLHDLGRIEAGRIADAVVYGADPLGDSGNTLRVEAVMKGGHLHDARQLMEPFRADYDARSRQAWLARGRRAMPLAAALAVALAGVLWVRARRGAVGTAT